MKSTRSTLQNSGVYKIVCDTCPSYYIGQTGRSFSTRYKEHLLGKKGTNIYNSSFADHLLITGHKPKELHDISILHTEKKGHKLDVLEEMEIFKHFSLDDNFILNEQVQLRNKNFFNAFEPLLKEP